MSVSWCLESWYLRIKCTVAIVRPVKCYVENLAKCGKVQLGATNDGGAGRGLPLDSW